MIIKHSFTKWGNIANRAVVQAKLTKMESLKLEVGTLGIGGYGLVGAAGGRQQPECGGPG